MRTSFWKNKRVVVTGSSGFVGTHLVSHFVNKGASVLGITRHPKNPAQEKKIDTCDKHEVFSSVKLFAPDVVFHLASEALVEEGQEHPYETFVNNIVSTLNVLESCRTLEIPRIIVASTAHVYGDTKAPFRENEPARPSRPYETSKTCTDLIAQSYADSYNLPVLIPRFVNIYGPGDTNMTRIIPKTIRAILRDESPTLWDGRARRDYLFIDDVVRAYELLVGIPSETLERNRIFNFATGKSVTAKKLMEKIVALMQKDTKIQRIISPRTHELTRQNVSWQKAKRILGWEPETNLDAGLQKTIDWFTNHYDSLN